MLWGEVRWGLWEVSRVMRVCLGTLDNAGSIGQSHLGGYKVEKLPKRGQEALLQLAAPEVLAYQLS